MGSLSIYDSRVKSDCEVKTDATLYAYYSWDDGSPIDEGPNGLNGSFFGDVSIETGYLNKGLFFSADSPISYFVASGFAIVGMTNRAFSTSIWVKPTSLGGTILLIAINALGIYNCHPILGMKATGEPAAVLYDGTQGLYGTFDIDPLQINQWTHLVQTFSVKNGRKY